jgi:hypothetical protein
MISLAVVGFSVGWKDVLTEETALVVEYSQCLFCGSDADGYERLGESEELLPVFFCAAEFLESFFEDG